MPPQQGLSKYNVVQIFVDVEPTVNLQYIQK